MIPGVDRDSRPWWESLARHEHVHQQCDGCGRWRWPPRAMCGECGSFDWLWQPVTGTGTVVSHITTHHSFLADLPAPYTTVFVALEEQGDIVVPSFWCDEGPPAIGERVRAVFVDRGPGETLLGWERINAVKGEQ